MADKIDKRISDYKNRRDHILKNFPTLGSVGTLAVIQGATVAEW